MHSFVTLSKNSRYGHNLLINHLRIGQCFDDVVAFKINFKMAVLNETINERRTVNVVSWLRWDKTAVPLSYGA